MGDIEFRDASLDDAALHADVYTTTHPFAVDPLVVRYEWAHPQRTYITRNFVVLRDGAKIGVASTTRPRWDLVPDRFGTVSGEVLPEHRDAPMLAALLDEMERRLATEGATRIATRANEGDELRIAAILAKGYQEDRRQRRWVLDLVASRERILRMADQTRARMRAEGVRIVTLAEDDDPERYRKIWRLNDEALQDVPTTLPVLNESYEEFLEWSRAPDMHDDRFWIARQGQDIVGVSVLAYPPVRGTVLTAWTGTARRARGRGVARALKCQTLAQAIGLGVDRVRTGNDAANDPILHINESMGYVAATGSINFLKTL